MQHLIFYCIWSVLLFIKYFYSFLNILYCKYFKIKKIAKKNGYLMEWRGRFTSKDSVGGGTTLLINERNSPKKLYIYIYISI